MIVKKSIILWDHIPTLEELKGRIDPDRDATIEEFRDDIDLEIYFKYTGLRLYTNGRDLKENESNIRSEMKYSITFYDTDQIIDIPDYIIPSKEHYILV